MPHQQQQYPNAQQITVYKFVDDTLAVQRIRVKKRSWRRWRKGQMICSTCHTTNTPAWRKGEDGQTLCNACGLSYSRHNRKTQKTTATETPPPEEETMDDTDSSTQDGITSVSSAFTSPVFSSEQPTTPATSSSFLSSPPQLLPPLPPSLEDLVSLAPSDEDSRLYVNGTQFVDILCFLVGQSITKMCGGMR